MGAGGRRGTNGIFSAEALVIHLDTSFLIRALVSGTPEDRTLRRWLAAGETIEMSSVAWTEFR